MKLEIKLYSTDAHSDAFFESHVYGDNLPTILGYARASIIAFWRQLCTRNMEIVTKLDEERARFELEHARLLREKERGNAV